MRIIEIEACENGSHRNQASNFTTIPEGWAVIPDDMETPNFPFGDIEVEEKDGVMVVTKWIAGEMPEPTPMPEPIEDVTWDSMAEAIKEGVNDV